MGTAVIAAYALYSDVRADSRETSRTWHRREPGNTCAQSTCFRCMNVQSITHTEAYAAVYARADICSVLPAAGQPAYPQQLNLTVHRQAMQALSQQRKCSGEGQALGSWQYAGMCCLLNCCAYAFRGAPVQSGDTARQVAMPCQCRIGRARICAG